MSLFAALFAALKNQCEVCGVNYGHTYTRAGNFSEKYNQRNSHINLLKRLITDVSSWICWPKVRLCLGVLILGSGPRYGGSES
jgi:hypothetical protein